MRCHGNGCNWTTHPHLHADMLQPTPVPDPSTTSTSPGPPHFVSATCPQPGSSIAPYLQQPTCSYIALAATLFTLSDTGTELQTFHTGQVTVCCNTTQWPYLLQLCLVLLNQLNLCELCWACPASVQPDTRSDTVMCQLYKWDYTTYSLTDCILWHCCSRTTIPWAPVQPIQLHSCYCHSPSLQSPPNLLWCLT